jgi:DNA-binding transcriptional LysR family regulator
MEIFELHYFAKVSDTQNIHKAAEILNISPSAISKAIARLESEVGVKLFKKSGRNIKITPQGLEFKKDVFELLALEKRIRESYDNQKKPIQLKLAGSDMALTLWGPKVIGAIKKQFPNLKFELLICSNDEALELTQNYGADLSLVFCKRRINSDSFRHISTTTFKTFISPKHPLSMVRVIDVKDLLKFDFIAPDPVILGLDDVENDGWRDDKFPREHIQFISSMSSLKSFIREGMGISYLPEEFGKKEGFISLNVDNCPYQCIQHIYLVKNKHSIKDLFLLNIFDSL